MECSDCRSKSHPGQVSIATSEKSFSGEYHISHCDYLCKISIMVNEATDTGTGPHEI